MGLPILFALLQIFLFLKVFRYDTPVMLKQNRDHAQLRSLMSRIYAPLYVDVRIAEIVSTYNEEGVETGLAESISYPKVCCSPKYSQATFVGCMIALLQQTTGINIFIFYSNTLFTNLSKEISLFTPNFTSGMMGITDFVFSVVGCVLLNSLGRKTMLFYGDVIMAISLLALGVFTL